LSRPNFFNIVPWEYVNPTARELQYGDPQLLHTTAWNYDVFLSFYNKFGLFTIGGFYKELQNIDFIATFTDTEKGSEYNGWAITEPRNIQGLSTVRGLEFDFQTNLSSLNSFLNGIVFGANLTLSKSKTYYPFFQVETVFVGPPVFFETYVTDTVRQGDIVGQADVLANINLGYERGGFSGRISMIYQSDALSPGNPGIGSSDSGVGSIPEQDYFDQANYRFDVALKQKIDKKGRWTVLLNLNNITNTPERAFLGVVDRLREEEFYGMTADLGLVFKFR
ncbi:MAG: TonB-dependent receptor, partial [Saprospiraceae bacterium]|nr:TonB-dependent receptor [Saprospiraceae bacterium]